MKREAQDKYGILLKNGDIIDIKQTVNGCRYFVIIDLDKLDVRYYDNNHQGVGFDTWVAIDRKYEYNVEQLLDMEVDPIFGFIESEIEVVGRLSEIDLLQTQLGTRSGVEIPQIEKTKPNLTPEDQSVEFVLLKIDKNNDILRQIISSIDDPKNEVIIDFKKITYKNLDDVYNPCIYFP